MKPIEQTIHNVFDRKQAYEAKKKMTRAKGLRVVALASCVCLLLTALIGGGAMASRLFAKEDYRILIDINPSIALSVTEGDRIKSIEGLNDDGVKALEALHVKGKATDEAVKEVISQVIDQGYLSEEANSVLVSIEGADKDKAEAIKEDLADCISQAMSERSIDGAVLVQEIPSDDDSLTTESEAHGISAGKAQLIHQILEQNKFHTFEELAEMSIHELNLLRVSYLIELGSSVEAGTPGELSYIGAQRATEIALENAKLVDVEVTAKLECRESVMLYCVEFEDETNDYRYRINAVTGEILSAEKIDPESDRFFQGDQPIATIGENAALRAALAHADMENHTLIRFKFNRDWVDGTVVYNLYFTDGITSGKYVLNARTGEILQYGKTQEYHDRSVQENVIGVTEAKRVALAKDGLIDGNVSKCDIQLKAEGDTYVYELSYLCNAVKYTAKIDGMNGTVLSFDKVSVRDNGAPSVENGSNSSVEDGSNPSVSDQ